jgi:integrase
MKGCIYLRGRIFWARYYRNGRAFSESTKQTDPKKAERFLQRRVAQVITDTFTGPKAEKVRVSALAEICFQDYRIYGRRSLPAIEFRWKKHLAAAFGDLRATQMTAETLSQYIERRQREGAANATINRELAALKRMFSLGVQTGKIPRMPGFPDRLTEDNIRTGFLEDKRYVALGRACGEVGLWLRAMFEVGYTFGWRVGELLSLRVRQVNMLENSIRLEPGTTKNGEGREIQMDADVRTLLGALIAGKQPDDLVFTRDDGSAVRDFRKTWRKVCAAAEVPGLLFHDLRRTAVRNMIRDGTPEKVAMSISGHRTRSVFDRYHIVAAQDKNEARLRMEARKAKLFEEEFEQPMQLVS